MLTLWLQLFSNFGDSLAQGPSPAPLPFPPRASLLPPAQNFFHGLPRPFTLGFARPHGPIPAAAARAKAQAAASGGGRARPSRAVAPEDLPALPASPRGGCHSGAQASARDASRPLSPGKDLLAAFFGDAASAPKRPVGTAAPPLTPPQATRQHPAAARPLSTVPSPRASPASRPATSAWNPATLELAAPPGRAKAAPAAAAAPAAFNPFASPTAQSEHAPAGGCGFPAANPFADAAFDFEEQCTLEADTASYAGSDAGSDVGGDAGGFNPFDAVASQPPPSRAQQKLRAAPPPTGPSLAQRSAARLGMPPPPPPPTPPRGLQVSTEVPLPRSPRAAGVGGSPFSPRLGGAVPPPSPGKALLLKALSGDAFGDAVPSPSSRSRAFSGGGGGFGGGGFNSPNAGGSDPKAMAHKPSGDPFNGFPQYSLPPQATLPPPPASVSFDPFASPKGVKGTTGFF